MPGYPILSKPPILPAGAPISRASNPPTAHRLLFPAPPRLQLPPSTVTIKGVDLASLPTDLSILVLVTAAFDPEVV